MNAALDPWRGGRIGLFGGTFDPPHTGHVGMARHARDVLGLDRVLFSVAPNPPHKPAGSMSVFEHRVAMVRLAIDGADGLELARIEDEGALSFTVDLLRACRSRTRADLYFIIGADSLGEFPTWKDPAEILRLATMVVFARGREPLHLEVPGPAAIVVFDSPVFDVSSTAVRRLLGAGDAAGGLIDPRVAGYAREHGLYRRAE
jgi:nicotinate-nucleotide adenylyltransferase